VQKIFLAKHDAEERRPAGRAAYTDVFGGALLRLGGEHPRLCAVTAACATGRAWRAFSDAYPGRTFDVGISESHGACFSSGLAFGGFPTVYAVYSTFAQRAYDQVFHDICLQGTRSSCASNRVGDRGEDGPTHHGVFDIAALRHIPSIVLAAPRDGRTLVRLLEWAVAWPQPVAIRYPREKRRPTCRPPRVAARPRQGGDPVRRGRRVALFAYGAMVKEAFKAAELRAADAIHGRRCAFRQAIDGEMLAQLAEDHETLVTLEDHALAGGFGAPSWRRSRPATFASSASCAWASPTAS